MRSRASTAGRSRADGNYFRRVVASPEPEADRRGRARSSCLVGAGAVVVCAGGGGIPVVRAGRPASRGVEAVIDKDLTAALLAESLGAERLVLATDVPFVLRGWGTPAAHADRAAAPAELRRTVLCRRLDGAEGRSCVPVRRAHRRYVRDRLACSSCQPSFAAPRARRSARLAAQSRLRSSTHPACAEMRMIAAQRGASVECGGTRDDESRGGTVCSKPRGAATVAHASSSSAEHLPAVRSVALRYRNLGLPVDDLVQEGSIGLLEAIDRYEPERGPDFESYARFRIRRAIRNALTEQSRLIRLPKQIVERRRAIERAEANIKTATGHTPTTAELAAATGLSPAAVVSARTIGMTPSRSTSPCSRTARRSRRSSATPPPASPEDETVEHEQARRVDDAVDSLPGRQRDVVSRHFGLGCEPEQIAEVAAELHVSQQRARAIERDALYALRERLDPAVTPRRTR